MQTCRPAPLQVIGTGMERKESLQELLARERFAEKVDNPTPLYMQMANVLRGLIEQGRLRPGEAFPSERTIAETTSLSRVTIRKGIESGRSVDAFDYGD